MYITVIAVIAPFLAQEDSSLRTAVFRYLPADTQNKREAIAMSRVHKMPTEAIDLLLSSRRVSSRESICRELIYNSLDAEATSINVSINTRTGSLEVQDDGHGIPPADVCD